MTPTHSADVPEGADALTLDDLEAKIRKRITPTPEEVERVGTAARRLEAACAVEMDRLGLHGTPSVQGSVAKGTWLAGNTDLDTFLLLDPSTPEEALKQAAFQVGEAILDDPRKKYAQHPYLIGRFDDMQVDLVPAYAVADPRDKMTAVDRTPFHTAWVRQHLDDALAGEVRLAKRWSKGVGIYGAETAVGGFSGYLVEVLVIQQGGFRSWLQWLARGPDGLSPEAADDAGGDAVLRIPDPVDAGRNCAAAVRDDVLQRACHAARSYLLAPTERFFYPAPPRPEPASDLGAALDAAGASWVGLLLQPQTDRLDIVFPQFQRTARLLADDCIRAGFPCRLAAAIAPDGAESAGQAATDADATPVGPLLMHWIFDDVVLPPTFERLGPAADKEPNAGRFRDKWSDHDDAVGPVAQTSDGRLAVTVRQHARTPAAHLATHLARLATAKHVKAAIRAGETILDGPHEAVSDESAAPFLPAISDAILQRYPWER